MKLVFLVRRKISLFFFPIGFSESYFYGTKENAEELRKSGAEVYPYESNTTIKTNNRAQKCIFGRNLPTDVYDSFCEKFPPNEVDTGKFIKYKGKWRYIGEFIPVDETHFKDLPGWDAYIHEEIFSGLIIRWSGDKVILGNFYINAYV